MAITIQQTRGNAGTQSWGDGKPPPKEAKTNAKSEHLDNAEVMLVRLPEIFYLLRKPRGTVGLQSYGDLPPSLDGAVSPAAGDLCLRRIMIQKIIILKCKERKIP